MIRMHECYLDQGLLVKDAIFQYVKGIFLYFDCRCWAHLPTCREVVTKKYFNIGGYIVPLIGFLFHIQY
jgi:hypothetical protein